MTQTAPMPPENVRVVHGDGTTTPVELVYDGLDEEGMHVWTAVPHRLLDARAGDSLKADVLPPNTVIAVDMKDPRVP